ncbi:ATP-binding protein [Mesobacillus harenae]|uniref:ATP-binding protein n=1 Tax=Mesobacillus harenae TaxID=2213203 RepID=UPI001580D843|nr:sensor histidine kinase [Mesobacillus harenae]
MKKINLQGKISLFIFSQVFILAVLVSFLFHGIHSDTLREETGKQALYIATTVSKIPAVIEAFELENPELIIQPIANEITENTGAQFIVVGNKQSVRYSHPVPDRIGKKMVGGDNERALLKGESYVSHAVGTLGPSIRGKVPIRNAAGEIIGVVSVGILQERVESAIDGYEFKLLLILLVVLLLGFAGSYVIATNVKRSIYGLEPHEIASQFVEKKTIIESVRDGIIAINKHGFITDINSKAFEVLGLKKDLPVKGKPITEVMPNTRMLEVLEKKQNHLDDEILINDKEVIVNRLLLLNQGKVIGVVASFRPKDEIDALTRELTQIHSYAEVLRSQTHEYSNKLNTISGLIQLQNYQEALDFIQTETSHYGELIQFLMKAVPDAMIAGIILGKYNRAQELKVDLTINPESTLQDVPDIINREKIVTIIGNLLDNGFDAVLQNPDNNKKVELFMTDLGNDLIFEIEDNGPGILHEDEENIFKKGFTRKRGDGRGFGLFLVEQAVNQLNGYVSVVNGEMGGALFTVIIPKKQREGNL